MRIVCMSDLHTKRPKRVPDGDVLVIAGDWCTAGYISDLAKNAWVGELPHKHKIGIAGNHDFCFQNEDHTTAVAMLWRWGVTYLQDELLVIDGLKFYGSPWQPEFHNWAFNLPRGKALAEKWAAIPDDTNVLITHGPPQGIRDATEWTGECVGDADLYARVIGLKALKLHVFGHIHYSHGQTKFLDTLYVNAAICDERYSPTQAPIVVDL